MIVLSFISMYVLMHSMANTISDVNVSLNQFYMAGLMTAPMVVIETISGQQAETGQMRDCPRSRWALGSAAPQASRAARKMYPVLFEIGDWFSGFLGGLLAGVGIMQRKRLSKVAVLAATPVLACGHLIGRMGMLRFSIEFVRVNARVLWGLTVGRLISIGAVVVGVGMLFVRRPAPRAPHFNRTPA